MGKDSIEKWKNKTYKIRKAGDRIPIVPLARSRSKKQEEAETWIKKGDFKPGSQEQTEK